MSPRRSSVTLKNQERSTGSSSLFAELDRLAAGGATGRLRLGDRGAVYLTEGQITFAECADATDLESLVTVGRDVEPAEWRKACASDDDIDAVLTSLGGRLGRAELEIRVLISIFDAVFFLADDLNPAEDWEFSAGIRHELPPLCRVSPPTVAGETRRRRAQLNATWPSPAVDSAPVAPVRRIRRQRVILTGLQAEMLLNADERRTPADLARDLGRPAYGCLLAVRALAAAELISTVPEPAATEPAPPRARSARGRAQAPATASRAAATGRKSTAAKTSKTTKPATARRTSAKQATSADAEPVTPRPRARKTSTSRGTAARARGETPDAPAEPLPTRGRPAAAADDAGGVAGNGAAGEASGTDVPARWTAVDEALLTRLYEGLKELS